MAPPTMSEEWREACYIRIVAGRETDVNAALVCSHEPEVHQPFTER